MFKSLFAFYSNIVDTPFMQSKLNIFFYVNSRVFKLKLNNIISVSISNLQNFKFKELNMFFNITNFEFFYTFFIFYFFSWVYYTAIIIV